MNVKNTNWFERGADAFERVRPGYPRCYVCPLCLKGFLPKALDANVLTREHAPPKALGGRTVALACRKCNSSAGYNLDNEMLEFERIPDFVYGTMPRPVRARFEIDGRTVNVDMQATGGSILVSGLPGNNDPSLQRAWEAKLSRLANERIQEAGDFRLTFSAGDGRKALLGWLRAAYLVAFAALGYRYIFTRQLQPVREQLADSNADLLKCFSITIPDASHTERRILLIQEPLRLRSLLVQLGRYGVFLPSFVHDVPIYERLEEERSQQDTFHAQLSGKILPWPHKPVLELDFL